MRPGGSSGRRTPGELEEIVLRILRESATPPSAYDIAARAGSGAAYLAPNQAYRTLERLIAQGRASRVETCGAYVVRRPGADLHLICARCGTVRSAARPDLRERLAGIAEAACFHIHRSVTEVVGTCRACAGSGDRTVEAAPTLQVGAAVARLSQDPPKESR
ncbi:transcriptional repressor [Sphingomonas sp. PL-96]|uniref:Fur family transcriptional regulator n=1 Tax=Sphingomonas sp. PL-96 TaxID=2887201 RepID=UPI001E5892CA|nr:transcriptional repressor [Sphingomonas sp. PL-96]MCC2977097.1 transcriptional repressor [Sphingomonas sp. PL-96]